MTLPPSPDVQGFLDDTEGAYLHGLAEQAAAEGSHSRGGQLVRSLNPLAGGGGKKAPNGGVRIGSPPGL